MTFTEFKVWWDDFQRLELGPALSSRNPALDSIAGLVAAGGGSVRTLMRYDFAVEGAALNCLDRLSPDYAAHRQTLERAVSDAKAYVAQYMPASAERRNYEGALDDLLGLV